MRTVSLCILLCFMTLLLSSCWDSVELDESIMVVGIGFSKKGDKYQTVVEAIAPSSMEPTEEEIGDRSFLLTTESDTLLDAAREVIHVAKRRLFFTHAEVWVIHSELAEEEDMSEFLDALRREQMLRLNSFLFVTDDNPMDVFSTTPLFSKIASEELIAAFENVQYTSDYPSITAKDFFKQLFSPIANGYLPFVKVIEQGDKVLSELNGSAIFKKGKMVGKLDPEETFGLLWLNNEMQGGSISVASDDMKATFKLISGETKIQTKLDGDQLVVNVDIQAQGMLSDQNLYVESIDDWIDTFSEKISLRIEEDVHKSLSKMQNDFTTDVTGIGMEVYRKHTDAFNQVSTDWDNVFAQAKIHVHVDTEITSRGLIERPGYHMKTPEKESIY